MSVERLDEGTPVERWLFSPDEPEKRCAWPTVALARRLEAAARLRGDFCSASVLAAYQMLLAHPAGTEVMVGRLRALRRAEKETPTK
ncbi:MAG: hypothetical protein GY871_04135 [Actinomycetales bacterium]|nr:hypothetical protein [Actinomycetales bacterium]